MFGHVQANLADLSDEEKQRYRAAYCGLCHTLGRKYGFLTRFMLTYDLTFLALLLSSLYEPDESCGNCRCVAHPCRKHCFAVNACTEYAADMTIALTYYKCLDDWEDDRSITAWLGVRFLRKKYQQVKALWSEQCTVIEQEISALAGCERDPTATADAAANCFGRLMARLFIYKKDNWEDALRALGYGLGRYIYFADAAVDYQKDRRAKHYNPLDKLAVKPEEMKPMLRMILGEASRAFEFLPLVQDSHLLKNILYSGIWIKYNRSTRRKRETNG